jgi:adenylate kinase family enzyme
MADEAALVERVVVYGSSGAGKSTLAAPVAAAIRGAHVELDALAFDEGFRHVDQAVLRQRFADVIARSARWVVEGMHRDQLAVALAEADTFVWLDLPRRTVAHRLLRRYKNEPRRRELAFVVKSIASHPRRRRHGKAFAATAPDRGVGVVHLTSARAATTWARDLQP